MLSNAEKNVQYSNHCEGVDGQYMSLFPDLVQPEDQSLLSLRIIL